ncbi:MAG: spermidine synthase [Proteobacteria bacterium]|nr:spermidine synthase [Pseudomonadota bacterium]
MVHMFEELDYQETPYGAISLRRRQEPRLNGLMLYEVKLGEEWLMSSLFTEAEIQLAHLGLSLAQKSIPTDLKVVVGGLGLGYTAAAVLENPAVTELCVVDIMQPVIDWHQNHQVPLGKTLSSDPRCALTQGDFFAMATRKEPGFSNDLNYRVDAILLDIDHSPRHWLNAENESFYSPESLTQMVSKLTPCGVFGLWSNDPPDAAFQALLDDLFDTTETHNIIFANPYSGGESANTVYLGSVT